MTKPRGVFVIHSGGPTAVLNASLAGIVDACREAGIPRVAGAHHGVPGVASRDWLDLSTLSAADVAAMRVTPGSVLGSSRRKLEPADEIAGLRALSQSGFDRLLFTGGNGSMKTALQLDCAAIDENLAIRVIGVPKTIDNDLAVTDHTPGYGSAARFFAIALRDIGTDNRALPPPVEVVEVIGRNTGWVVAATALAREQPGDPPHLIYCPERPPRIEQICSDVEAAHKLYGYVVVAVCEGLRDPNGEPFGAEVDRPGSRQHELAANLGHTLAREIAARTGLRTRSEKPGLLGRSSALGVSEIDRAESYMCGFEAVLAALAGHRGVMVGLRRVSQAPYRVETTLIPLDQIGGIERPMPAEWITPSGNDVTAEFLSFVEPLVGEVPRHWRFPSHPVS
jgi:6-phosphofructokinase